jgi:THO complex subunit 5
MPSSYYIPDQDDPAAVVGIFEELLSNDEIDPILLEAYAATLLSRMRHFNREASKTCTAERERTAEACNAMDQTHLGLQNLLYELRHLEREIQKCHQFEFVTLTVTSYFSHA